MTSTTSTLSTVCFETTGLLALRAAYFIICRHYVKLSLASDLRAVMGDEDGFAGGPDELSDGDGGAIDMDQMERGYRDASPPAGSIQGSSGTGSIFKGRVGGGDPLELDGSSNSASPPRAKHTSTKSSSSSSVPTTRRSSIAKPSSSLYSRLSTSVFCVSFSESCMLFTLVLFGEAVSDRTRSLNWSISLLALLFLIVFFIPFGICVLLTHRNRQSQVSKTIILTLVPFGIYLFLYYKVGSYIASRVVVEGAHQLGLINALLSRICVPGVMLIASLSGGGAVNTAWEAFEWRSISSAEPVTEVQIISAERSLYRVRLDISQRTRSLALATSSAAREAAASATQSVLSRWTSSNPAAAHLASSQIELSSLHAMEEQMMKDVAVLKKRKQMREMGRTVQGRLWLAAGWALSVYCVWRVFISCINLFFGYSQRQHRATNLPTADGSVPAGTDLVTSLLSRLVLVLHVDIDIAVWSRLIGLVLIGSIILANMRNVLANVGRIFKATSSGVSSSFMLLFLAELMSIYLLTSLISLPTSPSESSTTLLDTLPAFNVFSRLFDIVFLIAAVGVFGVRWVGKKIGQEGGVSAQYV